jgi:dinuclear metal center YbgI/SA1388 family protein
MNASPRTKKATTVDNVARAIDAIAPPALAQSWDNVGLLVGDRSIRVRRVSLCIDLTAAVVDESIAAQCEFLLAYHPPIFKPISSLTIPSGGTDADVFRCIRSGIAIYSTHTALDAADGGTNDVIAKLCGVEQTEPIEYVDNPGPRKHKLVVFVPGQKVEPLADAIFEAGAGRIGDYSRCSYRLAGQGTFFGGHSTKPVLGRRGQVECVDEIRLESVVEEHALPAVVRALRATHPYDEPAFDLYPLQPEPVRGIGRMGNLPRNLSVSALARKLKRATRATCVQTVGSASRKIDRAIIVVGAAGSLPFRIPLRPTDVIITGEIRHHDGLAILRNGCSAIALGHWASERPVLQSLAKRLRKALPGVEVQISKADKDPFGRAG